MNQSVQRNVIKVLNVAESIYMPGPVEPVPSFQQHVQAVAGFSLPFSLPCLVLGEMGSLTVI